MNRLLFASALFALTTPALASVSFYDIGNTTYGSNGSSFTTIGNTTYDNRGSSCTRLVA